MSTPLSSLLGEYAVALKVWLAPAARRIAADILIDSLGQLAEVHTDPLRDGQRLKGPAVLVVAADDLSGAHRDALQNLAQLALPGRVVLIGGTSDRDVLMDAINTWRAIRVVPSTAPGAEIVDAVRAAGEALRKAVALATAIDDLDIENTMLDSAINQMEAGQDRTLSAAKEVAMSTISQGLAQTVKREQSSLQSLATDNETLTQALRGVQTVTDLLGRISTRSAERASGAAVQAESMDAMVAAAADLAGRGPGAEIRVDASSGALSTANPYALIHLLTHMMRSCRASGPVEVVCRTTDSGAEIVINGPCPSLASAQGPVAHSVAVLQAEGTTFHGEAASPLTLSLPCVEAA